MRLLAFCFSCASLVAADFVGSDLLAGAVARGLEKAGPKLTVDFAGTLPGRRDFQQGSAAAAVLMLRGREAAPTSPSKSGAMEFRFASCAVVVATHAGNRLDQITLEQLSSAFARDARTLARNWNDIDPAARSELMTPAVSSPPGTLALEVFQGLVLEGQPFRADVRLRVEPELAADLLASRAGSVLLLPRPPTGRGKVLQVADGRLGKSTTAYGPDENNIHNGDYPLQVPLLLYVRQDKLEELRPALRWLFSDEAAALLEKQGLYPPPRPARLRFLQRLDPR